MPKHSDAIRNSLFLLVVVLLFSYGPAALAQSTAFTYQGRLTDGGGAANGQYDLQFQIFTALSGGTALGTVQRDDVQVTSGIFTVQLDFGAVNFNNNGAQFLEIGVRPGNQTGAYTTLTPRQPVTSTPYAIKSLNAATADGLSVLCVNCVTSSQIAGAPPGSASSYVQNTTTPQPMSDFNISGTGTANIFNAGTQFNIGGNRILSTANSNLFAGVGAGQSNSTGDANSFFGYGAGGSNTTSNFNSFFGQAAGFSNTTGANNSFFGGVSGLSNITGVSNSFFGSGAGQLNTGGSVNSFFGESSGNQNTSGGANSFFGEASGKFNTTGDYNSFFGYGTGNTNTTGSNNTLIGVAANVGVNNLSFATAIGSGASVSASNTVVLGRSADTVQVPGALTVTGTTTFTGTLGANIFNAMTQYNVGLNRVLTVNGLNFTNTFVGVQAGNLDPSGNFNSFFGNGSGKFTTTGGNNSFYGSGSGLGNQSGSDNAFFGRNTGFGSTGSQNSFFGSFSGTAGSNTASGNSFFGYQSGRVNTTGTGNSFFGLNSGSSNTTGGGNSFVGSDSGSSNTSGTDNSFFGKQSGQSNTTGFGNSFLGKESGPLNTSGGGNSFFGDNSGQINTTGSQNSFFGFFTGQSNVTGLNNTLIGYAANVGQVDLTNATAIGANAQVSQSNSLILGSINNVNNGTADTNVGIGTTAPVSRLHLNSNASSFAVTFTNAANTAGRRGYRLAFDNDRFTFQRADDLGNFSANQMSIDQATGNVGIGTTSPDRTLTVNGTADKPGGGSWDVFSDERLKTIKGHFTPGLTALMQLQPVRYEYKPDNALGLRFTGEHIGFGAQSVQKIIPEAVTQNDRGYLLVNNDPILWTMLNAIKEQQQTIEKLQQENRRLKARTAETETRLTSIETSVRRMAQTNRWHRRPR